MVLIDDINKYKNNIVKSFYAKINILYHTTTIKTGYFPVIHCGPEAKASLGPIRQSAEINLDYLNKENKELLRSGDNKIVKITFNYHPEFIKNNLLLDINK
jgi:GTPase